FPLCAIVSFFVFNLSALFGGSAVPWPFSNKVSTMQPFMFYKAAQEEKPRNYYFDKHSSSSRFQPLPGVAAFEPNQKSSHAVASQVCAHRLYLKLGRHHWHDSWRSARKDQKTLNSKWLSWFLFVNPSPITIASLFFRMTNALPYPSCSKMTKDNGRGFESCNSPSKSSSAEISLSTYREDSWFLAHPKSSIGSSMESIGTKLTI
ncbi:hypothetical protein GW17_00032884, partial [Ensete ventricosum]